MGNPISRKPGFSKRSLAAACREYGIAYHHERDLGNPTSNRDGFRSGEHVSIERYRQHLADVGSDALQRVARLVRGQTVALLCFEADDHSCHRSIVAEQLTVLNPTIQFRGV